MDLQVTKDHSLTVTLKDTLKFIIILHKVWKMHPYHQDYLGFYSLDSHFLSERVHGLLGNFTKNILIFPYNEKKKLFASAANEMT